jgi:hypothetical protein
MFSHLSLLPLTELDRYQWKKPGTPGFFFAARFDGMDCTGNAVYRQDDGQEKARRLCRPQDE